MFGGDVFAKDGVGDPVTLHKHRERFPAACGSGIVAPVREEKESARIVLLVLENTVYEVSDVAVEQLVGSWWLRPSEVVVFVKLFEEANVDCAVTLEVSVKIELGC